MAKQKAQEKQFLDLNEVTQELDRLMKRGRAGLTAMDPKVLQHKLKILRFSVTIWRNNLQWQKEQFEYVVQKKKCAEEERDQLKTQLESLRNIEDTLKKTEQVL